MKHTPLPWLADNGDSEVWGIFDDNGAELAYLIKLPSIEPSKEFDESKANAEFIVRACNCHYDLLDSLKFAKSVIQSGECWTETCEKMIDKIIAKAEGKND